MIYFLRFLQQLQDNNITLIIVILRRHSDLKSKKWSLKSCLWIPDLKLINIYIEVCISAFGKSEYIVLKSRRKMQSTWSKCYAFPYFLPHRVQSFTSICPLSLEPENQSGAYTLSNNDVDAGLPYPWGQTWLSQDLVRAVWKYGLNYSVQGFHIPCLCTHIWTHMRIPIFPAKLKSDPYVPNVLFSKYSSPSLTGLFTSPTGRPLHMPALHFSLGLLTDQAGWRWAGWWWRWQWWCMAVICDWGRRKSLMWEPCTASLEAWRHTRGVWLEQIRPSVFRSEYPRCLITSLKCGLLVMTSMTNRALWFPLGNYCFELQQLLHSFLWMWPSVVCMTAKMLGFKMLQNNTC